MLDSILEKVKNFPNIIGISSVRVKIGNLKMVSSQSSQEAFSQLAQRTLCEEASLHIEEVKRDNLTVEAIEGIFSDNSTLSQ